ncbi:hypothetical protein MSAN_00128200 [Mycena sanguinolenta]|uniref:Uncharacterized protein n=1 Tax=Mycena sanguinolenta TaxID=230812 RepID=A0A8H7DK26_9AGAR|nr:hypothetical protein MSAN_00128200 [Mycena sanguinolenta]
MLTFLALSIYAGLTRHPVFGHVLPGNPRQWNIMSPFRRHPAVTPWPKHVHKAVVLSWLLLESSGDNIHATLCALAGVVPSAETQHLLCRPSTLNIFHDLFSTSNPGSKAGLYAILHLLQIGNTDDSDTVDTLRSLRTSMQLDTNGDSDFRAMELIVKSRIAILLSENAPFEEADIADLIPTCADPFLRRQLFEVLLLTHDAARQGGSLFIPKLQDKKGDQVHLTVVNLAATMANLGKTLMSGLMDPSDQLAGRYAVLLAELAPQPAFCKLQAKDVVEEIFPILFRVNGSEDWRKSIITAVKHFCEHETTVKQVTDCLRKVWATIEDENIYVRCCLTEFFLEATDNDHIKEQMKTLNFSKLLTDLNESQISEIVNKYLVKLAMNDGLREVVSRAIPASYVRQPEMGSGAEQSSTDVSTGPPKSEMDTLAELQELISQLKRSKARNDEYQTSKLLRRWRKLWPDLVYQPNSSATTLKLLSSVAEHDDTRELVWSIINLFLKAIKRDPGSRGFESRRALVLGVFALNLI